jgi:hypothetical protein
MAMKKARAQVLNWNYPEGVLPIVSFHLWQFEPLYNNLERFLVNFVAWVLRNYVLRAYLSKNPAGGYFDPLIVGKATPKILGLHGPLPL